MAMQSAKACHIPAVIRKRGGGRMRKSLTRFRSLRAGLSALKGNTTMKKIAALIAVAGLATVTAACSKPAEDTATEADTTAVAPDAMATDAAAPAEGDAMAADAAAPAEGDAMATDAAPAEEAPAAE